MNFLITCTTGVESVLKHEIERLWGENIHASDRSVECSGPDMLLADLNLWIHTGNRVYMVITEARGTTFNQLFDLVFSLDWKKYIQKTAPIIVNAVSVKSGLDSIPAIQKIVKKAIVTKIAGDRETFLREDNVVPAVYIFILIRDNEIKILLDTSGDPLHKRGYRTKALEAPIKESLAAAMVMLSGWRYREPFMDPFCGSGTIAIEAALIARNIPPGIARSFAFEKFAWYPQTFLAEAKKNAEMKIIRDKTYTITGTDSDTKAIEIARANAIRAGVANMINWEVKDFKEYITTSISWTLVSNPPYWLRLRDFYLDLLYRDIAKVFTKNSTLTGGIITSYDYWSLIQQNDWKNRKLYNGNELCYFYTKKL